MVGIGRDPRGSRRYRKMGQSDAEINNQAERRGQRASRRTRRRCAPRIQTAGAASRAAKRPENRSIAAVGHEWSPQGWRGLVGVLSGSGRGRRAGIGRPPPKAMCVIRGATMGRTASLNPSRTPLALTFGTLGPDATARQTSLAAGMKPRVTPVGPDVSAFHRSHNRAPRARQSIRPRRTNGRHPGR